MVACTNCGQQLMADARFCTSCGTENNNVSIDAAAATKKTSYLDWHPQIPQIDPDAARLTRQHVSIPPRELKRLLKDFEKGSDTAFELAVQELRKKLPIEAVPGLSKIARKIFISGKKEKSAIELLGDIGTPEAADALKSFPAVGAEKELLVYEQMKKIGGVKAAEFFVEKSLGGDYYSRVIPLAVLVDMAHPASINELVKHGDAEKSIFIIDERGDNLLQNSDKLGWRLVGSALKSGAQHSARMRSAGLMLHPGLEGEFISEAPEEIQCTQAGLIRIKAIATLALINGLDKLDMAWDCSTNSFQKTVLAAAYVLVDKNDARVKMSLVESLNSKNMYEKILAYDSLVKLAVSTGQSDLDEWIIKGMNDADIMVSTAVSSAVLYIGYDPLFSMAINKTQDSRHNIRISLIPAVTTLAVMGEPNSEAALDRLMKDKNTQVRNIATEQAGHAKMLYEMWLNSEPSLN